MNIAVFCASANQIDEMYIRCAGQLGAEIGQRGDHLIYGGTNLGLMKEVACATLSNGGEVTGVIPECIHKRGVAAEGTGHLIIAPDMKERKQLLRDRADAFIALPGGWGTLEEVAEVITLKQLGEHTKPIVFLNMGGFYDLFFDFLNHIRKEGFISGQYSGIFGVVSTPREAMEYIDRYCPESVKIKYENKV